MWKSSRLSLHCTKEDHHKIAIDYYVTNASKTGGVAVVVTTWTTRKECLVTFVATTSCILPWAEPRPILPLFIAHVQTLVLLRTIRTAMGRLKCIQQTYSLTIKHDSLVLPWLVFPSKSRRNVIFSSFHPTVFYPTFYSTVLSSFFIQLSLSYSLSSFLSIVFIQLVLFNFLYPTFYQLFFIQLLSNFFLYLIVFYPLFYPTFIQLFLSNCFIHCFIQGTKKLYIFHCHCYIFHCD